MISVLFVPWTLALPERPRSAMACSICSLNWAAFGVSDGSTFFCAGFSLVGSADFGSGTAADATGLVGAVEAESTGALFELEAEGAGASGEFAELASAGAGVTTLSTAESLGAPTGWLRSF